MKQGAKKIRKKLKVSLFSCLSALRLTFCKQAPAVFQLPPVFKSTNFFPLLKYRTQARHYVTREAHLLYRACLRDVLSGWRLLAVSTCCPHSEGSEGLCVGAEMSRQALRRKTKPTIKSSHVNRNVSRAKCSTEN